MSPRAGWTGKQPQPGVRIGKGTLGGGRREATCGFSTLVINGQPISLVNAVQRSDRRPTKILNKRDRAHVTARDIHS